MTVVCWCQSEGVGDGMQVARRGQALSAHSQIMLFFSNMDVSQAYHSHLGI